MNIGVNQYESKLNKLLSKFLEPGYKLGNDVYLNILLSHLAGKDNEDLGIELRSLALFPKWLEDAVEQWENTLVGPSSSIATFTLNLASLISTSETNFIRLNNTNLYLRLCKILMLRTNNVSPSTKLGYLKMLKSLTCHKSGLDWLMSTDCWNDILMYCLENQTIYITREGYNFMYELLEKTLQCNMTFCEMVVKKIMLRLEADQFNKNRTIKSEIDNYQMQKNLTPSLKLINHILEQNYLLEGSNELAQLYVMNHGLENVLWNLLTVSCDPELLLDISKPLFVLSFAELTRHVASYPSREAALPQLQMFGRKFGNLYATLIAKKCCVEILKLCCLGHSYWRRVDALLPPSDRKEPILFENQIIVFQIMPMLLIAFGVERGRCSGAASEIREDELTELFIHKLFKISCEHTIRLAYSYRALLSELDEVHAHQVARTAVLYLMRVRTYMHRDRAVIAFQALTYALRYMTAELATTSGGGARSLPAHRSALLAALLDGLAELISEFAITWTDSVESICVTSLALDLLAATAPPLDSRLTVRALRLVHLTVARFMPPNLALLEPGGEDGGQSSVARLAAVLGEKTRDGSWEVRDTALDALRTVADISRDRYPPFRRHVLEAHLCHVALDLFERDEEAYVRAQAARALTALAAVPAYWDDDEAAAPTLEEIAAAATERLDAAVEPAAAVRREATLLLAALYAGGQCDAALAERAVRTAASSEGGEQQGEAREAHLTFWERAVERELAARGMLDGSFPPVTFTGDRKIVALTADEVRRRLDAALERLAACGCLRAVALSAVDPCDLQVARRAVDIAIHLRDTLIRYGALDAPSADADVTAFKRFLATDLRGPLDARLTFIRSVADDLGSLLDDILHSYEDDVHNAMDCY